MAEGRLILVVGPSGAGKDSLIAAAAEKLSADASYYFPKREITRPSDAGGEDHIEVSVEGFHATRESGGYALSWEAHGLCYGVPAVLNQRIESGATVVVNVSRSVPDAVRGKYLNLRVIFVTAPLDILAQRIASRGRESIEQVEARLLRAKIAMPQGSDVTVINNAGALEDAVARFVAVLRPEAAHFTCHD